MAAGERVNVIRFFIVLYFPASYIISAYNASAPLVGRGALGAFRSSDKPKAFFLELGSERFGVQVIVPYSVAFFFVGRLDLANAYGKDVAGNHHLACSVWAVVGCVGIDFFHG